MSDDNATGVESPPRGVDSYYRPGNFKDPSPFVYPAAANEAVSNFKIQPNLIAIFPVFRGHEEPYAHLREFFSIADTYQVNNTTKDGVRLRLFPFSLKDQAKAWFTSLEPGSIHSWSEMQSAFLDEFYSISKTAAIRNKIKSFRQIPCEQFHEAFSKLKELLRTCPHHDVPKWELVKVFYDGLDYHNQQFVMATSGATFFSRPMEEEWEFFEKLSMGKGVPNVSHNACSMCGDPSHSVNNCQSWGVPLNEEVNGVYGNRPRNDPFSESYNPRWRNHPNFRWKDDDNYNRPNNTQQQNHGYKPRPQQNKNQGQGPSNGQQSNIDQKFDLIISELAKSNQGANLKFESLFKSVANLERQIGQLAEEVHTREAGKLPSYLDLNPKHKPGGPEHVNMVTSLRNGKNYNNDIKIPCVHDFSHDVQDFVTDDEIVVEGKKDDNMKSDSDLVNDLLKDFPKPPTQNPKATESPKVGEGGVSSTTTPYLEALEKSASTRLAKKGPHSEDMWETFKQLKATLPKKIDLTEHVSAVLSSSLPPKFKDPRAPLILVVAGNITIKKALLDLDASINILPVSLVDKYDELFELFDGMTFHKKEEDFQIIEKEFLLSLEETPLQSQQVQQPTLNEVQEYVDCLLVHQDVLLRAHGSNKGWSAGALLKELGPPVAF
nr:hypothetical protein [Tanacetum cinerariifolium]GEX72674.1 hypothetical protein [Tanacetum cinerariifolium]